MKHKFSKFFALTILVIVGGSFLNPTPANGIAQCSTLGTPGIIIRIGGVDYTSDTTVSVTPGQTVSFTVKTIAEPDSANDITYPNIVPIFYTAPSATGRSYTTAVINSVGEINVNIEQNCQPDPNFGPSNSVTIALNPSVNGVCAVTHYNCTAGTSANNVNGASAYTWNCNGISGGTNASCTENKSTYTVSATANSGGSVTSQNPQTSTGAAVSFNISPNVITSATFTSCPLGTFSNSDATYTTGSPINGNCNVIFNFLSPVLTITTAGTGSGTVSPTAGPHSYPAGTVVPLTATPSYGSTFTGWSGNADCTDGSVTMNESKTCTATFTAVATPVNGACAATHYNCTSPAASTNNSSLDPNVWTWTCPGSNGGTNASCSESKAGMSGTLTPSLTSCSISSGGSTCSKLLTWTTTNPVAVSAVTSATGTPSPSAFANNSSQTFTIPYNNGNPSIFYLYNNGVQLTSASVTPYCVAGTGWDGSSCETIVAPTPDLTASAPTPAVATKDVSLTFSSTISNIGGASTAYAFSNFFQVASAANGGGTITDLASASTAALANGASRSITSPSHTFTTAGTYSVRACADKSNTASTGIVPESNETNNCSSWTNVTVALSNTPATGYFDSADCGNLMGWAYDPDTSSSSINVHLYKEGNVSVGTYLADASRPDVNTAFGITGNHGFAIPTPASLKNGVTHTLNVYAIDSAGGGETLTTASPKTINCPAPTTGTLTASNCTIASGASSCDTALSWTTTNAVGTSNITSNTPSANTIITTGNSGTNFSASVPYNSRSFFLNNNSIQLATATATATCASGTSWDGSKCAVSAPTCTETSFDGSVSPTSVATGGAYTVSCDYGVISDSIFPDVDSGTCSWGGFTDKTTIANFNCTAGFVPGNFSNNCVINNNPPTYPYCSSVDLIDKLTVTAPPAGSPVAGVCSSPDNHLNQCLSGTPSSVTNGISSWTWTCIGQDGGASDLCEEPKKKPEVIED